MSCGAERQFYAVAWHGLERPESEGKIEDAQQGEGKGGGKIEDAQQGIASRAGFLHVVAGYYSEGVFANVVSGVA